MTFARERSGDFDFPSAAEVLAAGGHARAAVASGNYELAAKLGALQGDAESAAAAVLMAGRVRHGLAQLEQSAFRYPESHLYAAFGQWCCDAPEAAFAHLDAIAGSELATHAAGLRAMIARPTHSAVIVADENNVHGAPLSPGAGFEVHHVGTRTERDVLVSEFHKLDAVDLLLAYDSLDPALLDAAQRADVPCVASSIDFDQRIEHRYGIVEDLHGVLQGVDLIVCATALEHHLLARMYGVRVASFPALPTRPHRGLVSAADSKKAFDVFFSGMAFVPHWPEKARTLFRIATIDDPDLRIRIHHGYLDQAQYRKAISASRYVPLLNRMGFSLQQDRTTDVLSYGARGLGFGGVEARYLLGEAGERVVAIDDATLEDDVIGLLHQHDPDRDVAELGEALADFFPTVPERDARTLKFVLFQTLFSTASGARAARRRAPDAWRAATVNVIQRFDDFVRTPDAPAIEALHAALDGAITVRPRALMPRFNKGRLHWMAGEDDRAVPLFEEVAALAAADGEVAPGDGVLPHLVRPLSEFMPYHAYYRGIVRDIADHAPDFPRTRAVIAATCRTYLSLHESKSGRFELAIDLALRALSDCDEHHPAARQLTKAAFAGGAPPQLVVQAFERAIALYPVYIDELLPLGVAALERLGLVDMAQSYIQKWIYFRSRVTYAQADARTAIADQTRACALNYYARLPEQLRLILKSL